MMVTGEVESRARIGVARILYSLDNYCTLLIELSCVPVVRFLFTLCNSMSASTSSSSSSSSPQSHLCIACVVELTSSRPVHL